jgi:predicted nucleic acid binding AN1-type Zn finger protein
MMRAQPVRNHDRTPCSCMGHVAVPLAAVRPCRCLPRSHTCRRVPRSRTGHIAASLAAAHVAVHLAAAWATSLPPSQPHTPHRRAPCSCTGHIAAPLTAVRPCRCLPRSCARCHVPRRHTGHVAALISAHASHLAAAWPRRCLPRSCTRCRMSRSRAGHVTALLASAHSTSPPSSHPHTLRHCAPHGCTAMSLPPSQLHGPRHRPPRSHTRRIAAPSQCWHLGPLVMIVCSSCRTFVPIHIGIKYIYLFESYGL